MFSSVADALRAWATEVGEAQAAPEAQATLAAPVAVAHPSAAPPKVASAALPPTAPNHYEAMRQSKRLDLSSLRLPVTVDNEPGTLVDLSTGGAQVVTSAMLKPGRPVRVTFPRSGPLAIGHAKVAWSRLEPPSQGHGELQYRAGLAFTKIEPRTIDKLLHPPAGGADARDVKQSAQ